VIDVRTAEEWTAGHVSCAHRLPVQDDPGNYIPQVRQLVNNDLTAPIVTYCHSGARAGLAEAALKAAGFEYVRNGGGYASKFHWQSAGCL
jgi:phage shock protein E